MATKKRKKPDSAPSLFGEGAIPDGAISGDALPEQDGSEGARAAVASTAAKEKKAPKEPRPAKKANKDVLATSDPDPRAPFDVARFFTAARPVLALLERDLLERARASHGVSSALARRHREETAAHRTADDLESWQRHVVRQIAAAWILSCVFVRVLEDRGLLSRNRIAGPGAEDSERAFYGLAPSLTPRDYLRMVFRELATFPAGQDLFDARHNPVWLLGPSAEASRALLHLFRAPHADAPSLRFGEADTRFLGDLYQDLSEDVRERFALLQTPAFVERYILDRTLEPAIARFGLEETTLLDPTCGSGHFLLGAFDRLFDHWQRERPGDDRYTALREALARVYGADLNPYAVAIARFRLTLAFIEKGGFTRWEDVPRVELNLAVADSLLHGPLPQMDFGDLAGVNAADWRGRLFALEDDEAARRVLGRHHAAVVGNPPYITVKDRELRELYRASYKASAAGKYSVAAPFTEKFFLLARKRGFVGMITANSFMKREFGKGLIEKVLPHYDLTGIVNTAGAYIPGHGTPTVLLFGTQDQPQAKDVWAVLGKRGEPSTPDDPAQGLVWSSIRDHGEKVGFDDEYVSVSRIERTTLNKHPWSLGGGGAAELKELLEERAEKRLGEVATDIGFDAIMGEDELFCGDVGWLERLGLSGEHMRVLVTGESVRDWSIASDTHALFPYDEQLEPALPQESARALHHLWRYRSALIERRQFGKNTLEAGLAWFEYRSFYKSKRKTPLSITYAEVATHNHFVLDRGGKVFKQTAPIIKLKPDATEDDHYALLAYLNSSTAAFLLRQTAHDKGNRGEGGGFTSESWEKFLQMGASAVGRLPSLRATSEMTSLAKQLSDQPTQWHLQEKLDWLFYAELQLIPQDHPAITNLDALDQASDLFPGQRPFEWVLRRTRAESRWFSLNAYPEPVDPDPGTRIGRWKLAAIDAIGTIPEIRLIEQPEHKRRWWIAREAVDRVSDAVLAMIDGLERDLMADPRPRPLHEPEARSLANLETVPYLAALRYTAKGLEKRAAWERTWDLQRREDAGEQVGSIPVPPKYDPKDFRDPAYYRLRGKLDVPKERFISYPGCESDDDKQPLYGWAGWTHLQQAQALAALYEDRKREGWSFERLRPMLEGLRELLPWLKQWHNEPSEEFGGLRLGEYFEGYVRGEERG